MKIWTTISHAVAGWRLILAGDTDWRSRFSLTSAGLATALAIFAFVTFLTVVLASMEYGMPHIVGILAAMLVLALPLAAFALALFATRAMLRTEEPSLPMLVPGTYAVIAFLITEALLAMIGGPIIMLSWIFLGYLLYRLARLAGPWNLGIAAGFAVLVVLLLVVMRLALYMLTNPAGSPI